MGKKKFKAESKRMLDLMINSIYTNKEIFLRELISNASDAIDKRYYKEAMSGKTGLSRDDFKIVITIDKEERTLTISDNGIGMTEKELEDNLGIIARSGSLAFKQDNEDAKDKTDIIGQFGVGFYSAFMVSKRIEVLSHAYGEDYAYLWISEGPDGFFIEKAERFEYGTDITLYLRDNTDEENYDEFLSEHRIRSLIKKYSDYIRYPIVMNVMKTRELPIEPDEDGEIPEDAVPEVDTYYEEETLNSMVPIWKKNKSEITQEEYNDFYKNKFFAIADPLKEIHTKAEGVTSYDALLFVPADPPFDYYTKDYKKGLMLYSSGVLIMEKCEDLLPDYFNFIVGLVDSQDLSLNISREMLQQNRQVRAIARHLEKKISSALMEMQEKERDKYDKFFKSFGSQLKYGIYTSYGMNKDKLQDFLEFHSSTTDAPATFKEYVERMPEDQKYIYYATGETVEGIANMPQMELFKEKGYEVLFFTEDIDEFAIKMMGEYDKNEFKSIFDDDLGFDVSEEEAEELKKQTEASKDVVEAVKEALGDKVSAVRISPRLKTSPVCLASGKDMSLDMERILLEQADAIGQMPPEFKAERILEINPQHLFFTTLQKAVEAGDTEKVKDYAETLYDLALMVANIKVKDPVEFSNRVCRLMK